MANDLNSFTFTGNLTRDAEISVTKTGVTICKFTLANNQKKKVGDSYQDDAHFFDMVIIGKFAEAVGQYLIKGLSISGIAEARQNRWEDEQGKKHSRIEFMIQTMKMNGGRDSESREGGAYGQGPKSKPPISYTLPVDKYSPADSFKNDLFDDDVPF